MLTVSQGIGADAAKAIAALEQECFAEPWSEAAILESMANPAYVFLLGTEEKRTVGYVGAYLVLDELQITNVAVTVTARRQGVGDRLIDALVAEASRLGAKTVYLEVRASNLPAIRLYEKHGFTSVGTRKRFYTHPTEDGILMTLYLP